MHIDLNKRLITILQSCKGDLPRISREASVSYSWITKFASGRIENPGYETLRRLDAALTRDKKRPKGSDQGIRRGKRAAAE